MSTALAPAPIPRCRSHFRFGGHWHTRCTRDLEPTHVRHCGPGIEGQADVEWHEGHRDEYKPRHFSEARHAWTAAPPRVCVR